MPVKVIAGAVAASLSGASWVIASSLASASVATTDHVVNGGFESGLHGWRTNGAGELLTLTHHARTGQWAAVLSATQPTTAVLNDAVNTISSTTAREQYVASVWVRSSTPKVSGELRLREVLHGALVGSGGKSFLLADTAWHQISLSYTALRSGASLDLNVLAWGIAAPRTMVIDDVSLLSSDGDSASAPTVQPVTPTTKPAPAPTTTAAAPTTKPAPAPTTAKPAPAPTTTTSQAPATVTPVAAQTTSPPPAPTTAAPAPTTTIAPAPTTTVAPAPTTTAAPAPTTTVAPAPTTTVAPAPTTAAPVTTAAPSGNCSVSSILVSSCGIWWGAMANPLGSESLDTALTNYETTIGRTVGIAHYYHRGTQLFPTATEISRAEQPGARRLLLENWKPENGSSWAQVAAGDQDAEIDAEAAYIRSHFSARFFLAIHHEPDDEVIDSPGSGFQATDYAAMFRHVVLRLRADGVSNIVTVMDYTGNPRWGSQSWFNSMYPGDDVVDWLAEDPYVMGPGGSYDSNYDAMVNRQFSGYSFPGFYTWAGQMGANKPIMLAEWGVDDPASSPGFKAAKFDYIGAHLADMPRVKALVYWNSNLVPAVGTTRVDSSPSSLDAFRRLGALPILNPPVPAY